MSTTLEGLLKKNKYKGREGESMPRTLKVYTGQLMLNRRDNTQRIAKEKETRRDQKEKQPNKEND